MKQKRKQPSHRRARRRLSKHLEQVNLYAAGIDVGAEKHFVAVPEGLDDEPVRSFSGFTADLNRMADWLVSIGIQTVAMEATGVYWIPVYDILEARGLEVLLVNARHVKNVTGRKTDILDCQWIQELHTYGLLSAAFRPPEDICALRTYTRQREMLVQSRSRQVQHMQKALRQMNLLLDNVVADITGVTGLKIIRAIVAQERDPATLAKYRDGRCQRSEEEIAKSLQGNYRPEHEFALRQALEMYDTYDEKVRECELTIEQCLAAFEPKVTNLPSPPRGTRKSKGLATFNLRLSLHRMAGVDLTRIDGINEITALNVLSETGTDMSRWKTDKHFGSWLRLAPNHKITGGKVFSNRTMPGANRAATALRMAAMTLSNSNSALGAFYRRQRARLGAPKAITATAYKLARLIYAMLKNGSEYVDPGKDYYEQRYRERSMKSLNKRATALGFQLVPITESTSPSIGI